MSDEFLQELLGNFLLISGPAALVIALYTGFRMFFSLNRIRKESRRSAEIGERIERDYEEKRKQAEEERRRLMNRFGELEVQLTEQIEEAQRVATGTRDRLIKLEEYLKDFFEVELKSVFESFDKTVASILGEMKAALLRAVDRIDESQAVVESKSFAQERILEGEGSVYRMIAESNSTPSQSEPQPGSGQESEQTGDVEESFDMESDTDEPDNFEGEDDYTVGDDLEAEERT
mgnify:CR=1 FL=1